MIDRLLVIGVGLIGGSLARALRSARHVREIVGFGRSLGNLQEAMELGVIDRAAVSLADAVQGADMIVLAVPVGTMPELLQELGPVCPATAVITDVGSVKGTVIAAARQSLGAKFVHFVPGHPIAGTEQSGVGASLPELFVNRRVVLTPEAETDPVAIESVRGLWTATGAQVTTMSAVKHDEILAASSHLPHVLAFALVDLLVRRDDHREVFDCVAGGFRDFTRIAGSDPVMWRDICLANRDGILEILNQYRDSLADVVQAIEQGDGQWLLETFMRAKHARDNFNRKLGLNLPEA
jgi:prephenate dehydrogenase